METTATTLGYFLLVGFAVGLAAGWWAATQRKDDNDDVINELRREVEAAKTAHRSYEQSVTSHFANTAQLLHRMQDDYRSIYTHIATGAQELCDAEVASQLDDTKLVGSAFDLADHLVDPAQPLDYAPKKTPDETGQLSEEFGLDKDYKPNVS
jgi:uncharacterized membrane-anchored protein YhcB (DUF1043 family)